jgi:MoxR-like ATPase
MAMPPARGEVVEFNRFDERVILKSEDGLRITYQLDELRRGELMKLMAFHFKDGQKWTSSSDEQMRDAARYNDASLRVPLAWESDPVTDEQEAFLTRRSVDVPNTKGEAVLMIRRIKLGEAKAKLNDNAATAAATAATATAPWPMVDKPKADKPKVDVKPEPAVGSIDAMIRALAEQAAANTPQPINEAEIRDMIAEGLKPIGERFDVLLELIADQKPTVQTTVIQLEGREKVELSGRQHAVFPKVLDCVDLREHVYLVGPAGTGKSTIGRQVSEALGIKCFAMSCNPQMPESRIFGFVDAQGVYRESVVYKWWNDGGVLVLDEVDNGHPGILSAFNLMLSSDEMTWPNGEIVKKHDDAVVIACANTYGSGANSQYVGRNMLDGAFLDRFVMVHVGIDSALEADMVKAVSTNDQVAEDWLAVVRQIRANVDAAGLKVIVSPRASVTGAKLLKRGWLPQDVIDSRVLRGLTIDQRRKALADTTGRKFKSWPTAIPMPT